MSNYKYNTELNKTVEVAQNISGHLTEAEMKFLFLLGSVKLSEGVVLEIGSFKGKSTFILAEASKLVGDKLVYAVDPLTQPSVTCPQVEGHNTRDEFYANIQGNQVEFYEKFSHELAQDWNKDLRVLWIDGDHTYKGVQADVNNFSEYLQPGAIIALHDVFNGHIGPLQVFANDIVQNESFGACGIVGSIGWAQYIGDEPNMHMEEKEKLYLKLASMIPNLVKARTSKLQKSLFKYKRMFISHGEISPETFIKRTKNFLS